MLNWVPQKRPNAETMLKHSWLKMDLKGVEHVDKHSSEESSSYESVESEPEEK